jgi:hypothetical protein
MSSQLASRAIATGRPLPRALTCLECERPIDVAGALHCPVHGVLLAQVAHDPRWEGEIVEVLYHSRVEQGRLVVQLEDGERRLMWLEDLRPLGMRPLTWEEQGPSHVPSWTTTG